MVLEGDVQVQSHPDFRGQRSRLYTRFNRDRNATRRLGGQEIDRNWPGPWKRPRPISGRTSCSPAAGIKSRRECAYRSLADQMDSATRDRKRDEIVSLWEQLEAFAHHHTSDDDNFLRCLRTLERTVLDLLAPVAAQDQQEIQSILDNANRSSDDVDRLSSRSAEGSELQVLLRSRFGSIMDCHSQRAGPSYQPAQR